MSKKNLARTVIEGGRHRGNKWDRRNSHAEFRARDKNYITEVKADLENWYDYDVEPTETVYKGFSDKLGPMYRWLAKQCGRLWADVRSEVATTFDDRTTAGRHILHDHLLKSVEETPDVRFTRYSRQPEDWTTSYRRYEFYVDGNGILREKTVIKPYWKKEKVPYFNTNQIANWLNGRVVGYAGKKLFWFVPADKTKKWGGRNRQWMTQWGYAYNYYSYRDSYGLKFLYLNDTPIYKMDDNNKYLLDDKGNKIIKGYDTKWVAGTPQFRQDRRLNDKELAFWNTIPEHYRNKVLEHSPNYEAPETDNRPYGYYY